jgi:putative ABC transport system permease protein
MVEVASDDTTSRVQARIANRLRDRHNIPPGGEDDFTVKNLTETASRKEESAQALTLLLASIAAVSLLVGGIGIMNIMLVSVTERTREIGIRMAVGAKPRHVMAQFLMESLALSVLGGSVGVALGLAGASRLAARFGWPMLVRPEIIAVAVGFSGLVGIVFGLYPARKAARLDPIVALRYE